MARRKYGDLSTLAHAERAALATDTGRPRREQWRHHIRCGERTLNRSSPTSPRRRGSATAVATKYRLAACLRPDLDNQRRLAEDAVNRR